MSKNNKKVSVIKTHASLNLALKNANRTYNLMGVQSSFNNIVHQINNNSLDKMMIRSNVMKQTNTMNYIALPSAIEEANKTMMRTSLLINNISNQANVAVKEIQKAQKLFQNINLNQIFNQYNFLINYNSRLEQYFLDHETQIEFGAKIHEIIEGTNEEIKNIFHTIFLNKLIVSERLWILPRITKKEYKELSKMNFEENSISFKLFEKYINQPETILDIIKNWKLDPQREKIMKQVYDNYIRENYETVIIMLTTQIDGILIDNLDIQSIMENKKNNQKLTSTDLRMELEEKMKISLDNDVNSWNIFIKKTSITFISYVMKPLYNEINFQEEDKINRHQMLHKGIINLDKEQELNQIIAIRFFIMLDTILYMINELKKDELLPFTF